MATTAPPEQQLTTSASPRSHPPRVLTIAGSDSSGGAGIEADLKVLTVHKVYGSTAITALTAQNTHGVSAVHVVPVEHVERCIDAVVEDVGVDVVKTGMLPNAKIIELVARKIQQHGITMTVIDPVMISTSGHDLIPASAIDTLINTLLPQTYLLTPNVPEALRLLGTPDTDSQPHTLEGLEQLAKSVQGLGPRWVLLKGGHAPLTKGLTTAQTEEEREVVVDILTNGKEVHLFRTPYVKTSNTHGTGCSLASAIAANLALISPSTSTSPPSLPEVVEKATKYIYTSLMSSLANPSTRIGTGNSPIDHTHGLYTLPYHPSGFVDYCLALPAVEKLWPKYIYHPFVRGIASGSLPIESFRHYLIQDYLFLVQSLRAVKMAGFKSRTLSEIKAFDVMAKGYYDELELHTAYCRDYFGLTLQDLEGAKETMATTAYTRFVLDLAAGSTPFVMQCAMMPCIYGYGRCVAWIKQHAGGVFKIPSPEGSTSVEVEVYERGNPYWAWVEKYSAPEYDTAVRECREELERMAVGVGRAEMEQGVAAFERAVEMEVGFWEEGLRGGAM
ncbi:hypothetical protein BJ508DRAFT_416700 [Ascobolus immersus RN42]|uniref:Phosphomethylpyrimidine kinase n=1 Tax=Ascobolus immersus RN42 TaxID=1160509 RepID=A0A3N4HWN0_ASCIM|nr:hypothetical protein BJ508DRAFT_416700 [Ascobolus immersus RN42]